MPSKAASLLLHRAADILRHTGWCKNWLCHLSSRGATGYEEGSHCVLGALNAAAQNGSHAYPHEVVEVFAHALGIGYETPNSTSTPYLEAVEALRENIQTDLLERFPGLDLSGPTVAPIFRSVDALAAKIREAVHS